MFYSLKKLVRKNLNAKKIKKAISVTIYTCVAAMPIAMSAFSFTSSASANYMFSNHGYARQFNYKTNHGGYFDSVYGADDLISSWSPTNTGGSITKEMWVNFDTNFNE